MSKQTVKVNQSTTIGIEHYIGGLGGGMHMLRYTKMVSGNKTSKIIN